MRYRKLGDIRVSEIGLGCSGFWGDKYHSERDAIRVVTTAYEEGVNFFDTGSNYSNFNAEPRLGRAMKEILAHESRDQVVISTKAGSLAGYAPLVKDDDLANADYSPAALRNSCLKSITNLNCDYLDVFQLHGFRKELLKDEIFECLRGLKREGLVRVVGVNTHFRSDMMAIANYPDVFDMVLTDCNLLQLDRFETIAHLRSRGISVVVGTVLAQGHLVRRKIGSIRNGSFFWYLARTLIKPTTRNYAKSSSAMRKLLADVKEMSASQAAFAYLLGNEDISSCLFGTTSVSNLKEVLAASGRVLSDNNRQRIESEFAACQSLSR